MYYHQSQQYNGQEENMESVESEYKVVKPRPEERIHHVGPKIGMELVSDAAIEIASSARSLKIMS